MSLKGNQAPFYHSSTDNKLYFVHESLKAKKSDSCAFDKFKRRTIGSFLETFISFIFRCLNSKVKILENMELSRLFEFIFWTDYERN